MADQLVLKEIPSFRVVSTTMRGKPSEESQKHQERITAWSQQLRGLLPMGWMPQRVLGIKGLSIYSEKDGYWKVCLPVSQEILDVSEKRVEEFISMSELPTAAEFTSPGLYAVFRYQGPYSGLASFTADKKANMLSSSQGLRWDGREIMELYLNDSAVVPESDLITNVCFPVQCS